MFKFPVGFFVWLIILLATIAWLKVMLGRRQKALTTAKDTVAGPFPYKKAPYLLTPAERTFYDVLRLAVGGRYTVFAKVRMFDVLALPKDAPNYQSAFNRVVQKQLDFVLCDPDTAAPELVIELDDSTHQQSLRKDRDVLVNEVLETAGLAILRVLVKPQYVQEELTDFIDRAVSRPGLLTVAVRHVSAHGRRAAEKPTSLPIAH